MQRVQASAGGVCDLGRHAVCWPKYRRPVLAGRCVGLVRTKANGHGWRIVALEIMPGHVRLFVQVHLFGSSSQIVSQFKAFTSRWLRAKFPPLRFRRPVLWSWSYSAAAAGVVSVQAVCWYTGTQDGKP